MCRQRENWQNDGNNAAAARMLLHVERTGWCAVLLTVAAVGCILSACVAKPMVLPGQGIPADRPLSSDEKQYSQIEERRAASIAVQILQRSDCRPEALIDFFGRPYGEHANTKPIPRLHHRRPTKERLDILEEAMTVRSEGPASDAAGE